MRTISVLIIAALLTSACQTTKQAKVATVSAAEARERRKAEAVAAAAQAGITLTPEQIEAAGVEMTQGQLNVRNTNLADMIIDAQINLPATGQRQRFEFRAKAGFFGVTGFWHRTGQPVELIITTTRLGNTESFPSQTFNAPFTGLTINCVSYFDSALGKHLLSCAGR